MIFSAGLVILEIVLQISSRLLDLFQAQYDICKGWSFCGIHIPALAYQPTRSSMLAKKHFSE